MGDARFCGQCGGQLWQGARYCAACGRAVPERVWQTGPTPGPAAPAAPAVSAPPVPTEASPAPQAPWLPPLSPAVPDPLAKEPLTLEPLAPHQLTPPAPAAPPWLPPWAGDGAPLDAAATVARPAPALPQPPAPPGAAGPDWAPLPPGPPGPGPGRRRALPWLVGAGVAVLLAGGGTAAALFLFRPAKAQLAASSAARTSQPSVGAGGQAASSGSSSATATSPAGAPATTPPTALSMDGVTIGVGAVNTDPDVNAVAQTLATYFGGIDSQNYQQAWDTYTPGEQAVIPFQPWSQGLSTTHDSQIVVQDITHGPGGKVDATVSFQSTQAPQDGPNPGETCTNWTLVYRLVPSSSPQSYLISKVKPSGVGHAAC
jgi:hypothetical protein